MKKELAEKCVGVHKNVFMCKASSDFELSKAETMKIESKLQALC